MDSFRTITHRALSLTLLTSTFLGAVAVTRAPAQATKDETKTTTKKDEAKAKAKAAPTKPPMPPTHENVPYGDHPRQVLDFYKADTKGPAPLVVFIHGGGWTNGDKYGVGLSRVRGFLDEGISVAAINYRFVTQAQEAGVKPPVKWPLGDDSPDPVARESTRLTCAAVTGAQTSLDPRQLREWMPNMRYGGHAFGFRKAAREPGYNEFQEFYDHRDDVLPWIKEYSPYEHAGPGDPPVFLDYPAQDKPVQLGEEQRDPTHSAVMGLTLQEKLRESGDEAHLSYPGHKDPDYAGITEFLVAKLKAPRPK
ncbi:MAG: alpha/beta hydrolase [Planctomycetia bacterium]|nr:alpha/beta hydrolase [Planctomycetia bacterium]